MLQAEAQRQKEQQERARAAQKTLNLLDKTKHENNAAAHLQMWAMSPFAKDGIARPTKLDVFTPVPKYASRFGDLTALYLEEVSYFM